MSLYNHQAAVATHISGRRVAHCKLSTTQRAVIVANLVRGVTRLALTTIGQAAALLRVSPTSVIAALGVGDEERHAIMNGRRPLRPQPTKTESESLAEHLARATPAERLAAVREVGVGTIWDSMIVPSLS
jgi:hypothetical protein